MPVQGTGSAGERRRLVGLGASEGLWRVGPRSCLRMTALWAWRGGGAGNVRAGELTQGSGCCCELGPGNAGAEAGWERGGERERVGDNGPRCGSWAAEERHGPTHGKEWRKGWAEEAG